MQGSETPKQPKCQHNKAKRNQTTFGLTTGIGLKLGKNDYKRGGKSQEDKWTIFHAATDSLPAWNPPGTGSSRQMAFSDCRGVGVGMPRAGTLLEPGPLAC